MRRSSRLLSPSSCSTASSSTQSDRERRRSKSRPSRSPINQDTEENSVKEPAVAANQECKMPVGSKSGVLAQQIHEEFLTCKICLDQFTSPKSLDCLHTFCEECIESHANSEGSYKKYSDYREFTCPLCRKRTTLPLGGVKKLPDNFLVANLCEVIDRQRPSKLQVCDFCKLVSRRHKEASAKCLDCNKLLCKACVEQHNETKVTRSHNIFDIEIEKDIECKVHPEEVVRFYCETCEDPVCILCTFNDHKDHDVAQFSEAVEKYKANVENLMKDCQASLARFEGQLETLDQCEQCIKDTIAKIQDISIDMISDIRAREKILIEEVHNIYGPDMMKLIDRKAELHRSLDGLRGTVQLTNLIIKGKDMELLLLQKEVQEKLQTFSKTAPFELPKTSSKKIHFVPGMLDMGYVHDSERPILSQTRRTFSHQSTEQDEYLEPSAYYDSAETQTDISGVFRPEMSTNTSASETAEACVQTEIDSEYYQQNGNSCQHTNGYHEEGEEDTLARRRRRRRERERAAKSLEADEYVERQQSNRRRLDRRNNSVEED